MAGQIDRGSCIASGGNCPSGVTWSTASGRAWLSRAKSSLRERPVFSTSSAMVSSSSVRSSSSVPILSLRPELTALRFVCCPAFVNAPSARIGRLRPQKQVLLHRLRLGRHRSDPRQVLPRHAVVEETPLVARGRRRITVLIIAERSSASRPIYRGFCSRRRPEAQRAIMMTPLAWDGPSSKLQEIRRGDASPVDGKDDAARSRRL